MPAPLITISARPGRRAAVSARNILARNKADYRVRAVTRKPDSDAAKELVQLGAEVAVADLDDAASVQRAMADSHGVYCVTNFWEHMSARRRS
jgi:uncharacterized protein YbjT (DUF2867 family)